MPDWTYQTVFRPVLRSLPYAVAQSLAFGAMGLLGRYRIGRLLISVMGHARPCRDVAVNAGAFELDSPCAMGCGVDLNASAVSAASLLGFGLIEVGPVVAGGTQVAQSGTHWNAEGLRISADQVSLSVADLAESLTRNSIRNGVLVIVRLLVAADADRNEIHDAARQLGTLVDGVSFYLPRQESDEDEVEQLHNLLSDFRSQSVKLFAIVDEDCSEWPANLTSKNSGDVLIDGVILEGGRSGTHEHGRLGQDIVDTTMTSVQRLRRSCSDGLIIANGGVQEPADAVALLGAGANVVILDSGFVKAGPGLPKRINNVVHAIRCSDQKTPKAADVRVPFAHLSWFWAFLLGTSLVIGGLMAMIIGWTRVVLPYDEEFLGMLRDEICGINPRLLPFMSHDRVTLAGTMLALGPLYLSLAWFGDRRGMHWARVTVIASSFVGFLSFFLFLGFGYFDPFHAFITAVLFQFVTLTLRSSLPANNLAEFDLHNTASWKRAMWAQLLTVVHGAVILAGGIVISSFGVTSVLVADDLDFMQTTQDALMQANSRLVPLVAHDRASFGGMLMSTGVAVLLTSLWGWQRGRRWLWWTLLGSGSLAYISTILIHWWVGYTSVRHLLPAYSGVCLLWLSMGLAKEWMFEDASTMNEPLSATTDGNPATPER